MVLELSAAGMGSPQVLMSERVDLVCAAYDYLLFKHKYEYQAQLLRARK
jgi:hypothetical protein